MPTAPDGSTPQGAYNPETNTLTLPRDAKDFTFTHEISHAMRDLDLIDDASWQSLVDYGTTLINQGKVEGYDGLQALQERYNTDKEGMDHEIVAHAMEQGRREGAPVEVRNIAKKIWDYITSLIGYATESQKQRNIVQDVFKGKPLEGEEFPLRKKESQGGETRFSIAPLREDSDAFKEWSGGADIIEDYGIHDHQFKSGEPVVMKVHHGTTHADKLFEFKGEELGNKEGYFGAVNYFTSSEYDAETNYLSDGADLTQRIELRQDQIRDELDIESMSEDELSDLAEQYNLKPHQDIARELASRELKGSQDEVLDLYVRVDNPVVIRT